MTERGRTIREAVRVALEGLPGRADEWADLARDAMRDHVLGWVLDYAARRGILLTTEDVDTELNVVIEELYGFDRRPSGEVVPVIEPCGMCDGCAAGEACRIRPRTSTSRKRRLAYRDNYGGLHPAPGSPDYPRHVALCRTCQLEES